MPTRRSFIGKLAAISAVGTLNPSSYAGEQKAGNGIQGRTKAKALLISATTLAGHKSLEHAEVALRELYSDRTRILLINFASLPDDRDAYAARMQRDFSRINPRFKVESLHAVSRKDARRIVEDAEAVYTSGGNTFLLLKELYDREVVGLIRDKVLNGMPYAGASAGSNIAGVDIGTTNDFPLVDVPTRRSLGILPGTYNPHHPDPVDKSAFDSRQYKIRQNARYYPQKPVFGVNNAGMISIQGDCLTLLGESGIAVVQVGAESALVEDNEIGNLSKVVSHLKSESSK